MKGSAARQVERCARARSGPGALASDVSRRAAGWAAEAGPGPAARWCAGVCWSLALVPPGSAAEQTKPAGGVISTPCQAPEMRAPSNCRAGAERRLCGRAVPGPMSPVLVRAAGFVNQSACQAEPSSVENALGASWRERMALDGGRWFEFEQAGRLGGRCKRRGGVAHRPPTRVGELAIDLLLPATSRHVARKARFRRWMLIGLWEKPKPRADLPALVCAQRFETGAPCRGCSRSHGVGYREGSGAKIWPKSRAADLVHRGALPVSPPQWVECRALRDNLAAAAAFEEVRGNVGWRWVSPLTVSAEISVANGGATELSATVNSGDRERIASVCKQGRASRGKYEAEGDAKATCGESARPPLYAGGDSAGMAIHP